MICDNKIIPAHMRDGAERYINDGIEPGGFMMAVLTNDFKGVMGRADDINKLHLQEWYWWVTGAVPNLAQGNKERVQEWIRVGGLNGFRKLQEAENGSQ